MRKRILAISSSSKIGGGPSHIFLMKKLLQNEFDFYLAMPKVNSKINDLDLEKFLEITERKFRFNDIYRLIVFAKKNSIDIIHAHGKGAGLIGRFIKLFVKKPLIYTFHGIHVDCLGMFEKILYLIYENITGWIDNEKIFVSLSEFYKAKYLRLIIKNNFSIINNSTNNMTYRKEYLKSHNNKIGIKNSNKNIISVCRLVDQKNIFEIFKIARNLPIYNFIILGDGYLYSKALDFLNKKNINNVYLLGNKKDVFKYLYLSDLFLSTSLYEGHPLSILEAMSIGLPIVASKVVGNIDTITDNNSGIFYKLGDIKDAKICIERIMQDEKLRNKISFNSLNRQRELFSTEKMKRSYISLYKKYL